MVKRALPKLISLDWARKKRKTFWGFPGEPAPPSCEQPLPRVEFWVTARSRRLEHSDSKAIPLQSPFWREALGKQGGSQTVVLYWVLTMHQPCSRTFHPLSHWVLRASPRGRMLQPIAQMRESSLDCLLTCLRTHSWWVEGRGSSDCESDPLCQPPPHHRNHAPDHSSLLPLFTASSPHAITVPSRMMQKSWRGVHSITKRDRTAAPGQWCLPSRVAEALRSPGWLQRSTGCGNTTWLTGPQTWHPQTPCRCRGRIQGSMNLLEEKKKNDFFTLTNF